MKTDKSAMKTDKGEIKTDKSAIKTCILNIVWHLILLLDVVLLFDDYSVFELSVIAVSTILTFVVYFVKKKDISIYSALACYVILLISDSGMIQL